MDITSLFWTLIIGLCTMLMLLLHIVEPDLMKPQLSYSATALGADFEMVKKENLVENENININGLQITKILNGKLKKETEIKEGFIVTKLNGIKVKSISGLKKGLRKIKGEVVLEGIYSGSKGEIKYMVNL